MALVEPGRPSNALAELIDDLVADVEVPTITVPVPNKPGWELVCMPVITAEQRKRWTKQSRNREWKPTDPEIFALDQEAFNATIVAETCVAILRNGAPVRDELGEDVTFSSEWLHRAVGKRVTHVELVRLFFRNESHIADAASAIAEAAAKPVPTAASSTS